MVSTFPYPLSSTSLYKFWEKVYFFWGKLMVNGIITVPTTVITLRPQLIRLPPLLSILDSSHPQEALFSTPEALVAMAAALVYLLSKRNKGVTETPS